MTNNNPFKQAEIVKKHLKVMVFGQSGSGKTTFALTAPNAAVIDTERGTDLYSGRDGIAPFGVLRANTLTEIQTAVAFLKTGKHSFETVILDSLTPVYDVLVGALESKSKSGEMSYREWGAVKRKMNALYNALLDLPMHVIITAREAVEYETSGRELRKVGAKPDADKSLSYVFDFVLQMNRDKSGTVIKSRGRDIAPEGGVIKRVTWDVFAPVLDFASSGKAVHLESMDEAMTHEDVSDTAQRPAQPEQITTPAAIEPAPACDFEHRVVTITQVRRVKIASGAPIWGMVGHDDTGAVYKTSIESRKKLGDAQSIGDVWDTTVGVVTDVDFKVTLEYEKESNYWWFMAVTE